MEEATWPKTIPSKVFVFLYFSKGPDPRYVRAGAIETQLFICGVLSKNGCFCVNSGIMSDHKDFHMLTKIAPEANVEMHLSPSHNF